MDKVVKRDGRIVDFDGEKIRIAVRKAMDDVGFKYPSSVDCVVCPIEKMDKDEVTVEEIQDMVEENLMKAKMYDVAKSYIRYRYKREMIRNNDSEIMNKVTEKLLCKNVQNQNANVDEASFGGRTGEVARTVMKQYALDNCMSKMARDNHLSNRIYIHDLDSFAVGCHNCLSVPIDDLLKNGFKTRQTDVRPANSVNTAFQLVAVLFQIQSLQQFGK